MKKIAVVYWSGTGNTQLMAEAIAKGASKNGAAVSLLSVAKASSADVRDSDGVAFGCPAMGNEVLEEMEMAPFFDALTEKEVAGKPVVLFGSYDWGDGQWMRDWEERVRELKARLMSEGLMVHNTPDQTELEQCMNLGGKLAAGIS